MNQQIFNLIFIQINVFNQGQPISGRNHRVLLLGNPVIWWLNALILVIFPFVYLIKLIVRKRFGEKNSKENDLRIRQNSLLDWAAWIFFAWALHYFPFFLMKRALYFHHYFPAFLCSCILTSLVIASFLSWFPEPIHHAIYGIFFSVLVYSFIVFSPLVYGMNGPMAHQQKSKYSLIKWLPTWDI